jgi:hypothetical protein
MVSRSIPIATFSKVLAVVGVVGVVIGVAIVGVSVGVGVVVGDGVGVVWVGVAVSPPFLVANTPATATTTIKATIAMIRVVGNAFPVFTFKYLNCGMVSPCYGDKKK